ncbi:D-aminoacylase [Mitsuokella sp. AF33-22]|uniref:N-acyl-D-amino-acid deacylase family protein n=1 Tax=Mitsuokella sp. AF33-22 TaxID=2292047 RepID=UPI000E4CB1BF|nr:D-aminoacylase [Mitsuokella sp. AF33-22]RHM56472.1 D-aminoacylase [Mitsuokella sp. AF33-22]
MRTQIRNVMIVDGSGTKPFPGNILLEDDKISRIGQKDVPADVVIDGHGLYAVPGFIDTHSHSDLCVLTQPELRPKIMQGITTEVLGQDGISMAPLPEPYISSWRKNLAGLDGDSDAIDWHYHTTAAYLSAIEQAKPAINEAYLVPHGNVRMEAMGLADKPASPAEIKRMQEILRRELEAGAYGLSTGLIYIPCAYAKTEELIELCKVVAAYDGSFVIHQRSEADTILESMQEVLRIGRESGVKVHFSHFKVCGRQNWKYIDGMLKLLDEAKAEGIRVSFDQYPYVAGSTMLGVVLPPWAHDGGTNQLMIRLKDPAARKRMIHDIEYGIPGWDNFIAFAGFDQIYITSVKTKANQPLVGLSLTEMAEKRHQNRYDALFDLLYEEENAVGMVDFYGTEDHVKTFMQRPEMNLCTDGLLAGKPHPRVFGAFPRFLGKYVREEKALTMEQAIYKITKKPAATLGIEKRGELRPGNYADLVLFDPAAIRDKGTFVNPAQYPEGIQDVFVNGVHLVRDGIYQTSQRRNGYVLRK